MTHQQALSQVLFKLRQTATQGGFRLFKRFGSGSQALMLAKRMESFYGAEILHRYLTLKE
ncbi:Uncharacterised protein [Vibrio cholerae]|nr:Uncharacterised protein [Vibrio cholerae]